MEFDHAHFIHAVGERTGLAREQAELAVTTTFAALGRAIPAHALPTVAATLPAELGRALRDGAETPAAGDFLSDLANHEHVARGFAREHAQVVLEQLAGLLDEHARARLAEPLRAHAPEAAGWLSPYVAPDERRPHPPSRADDRSLAGGRPGSRNPLSEARPDPGQSNSPAVTRDPHADTRLSSAHGISTEREHRSVAEGRPGSSRPVSEEQD